MNEALKRRDLGPDSAQPASSAKLGPWWFALEPRRGALFVVNIGAPLLIGLLLGEASAALVGGITGLLLSLADQEGGLCLRHIQAAP